MVDLEVHEVNKVRYFLDSSRLMPAQPFRKSINQSIYLHHFRPEFLQRLKKNGSPPLNPDMYSHFDSSNSSKYDYYLSEMDEEDKSEEPMYLATQELFATIQELAEHLEVSGEDNFKDRKMHQIFHQLVIHVYTCTPVTVGSSPNCSPMSTCVGEYLVQLYRHVPIRYVRV